LSTPVVGYVLRMFPDPAQVYIATEIRELERLGCSLRVFAYHQPDRAPSHAVFEKIRAPVAYIPDPPWGRTSELAAANFDCIMHNPGHYLRTIVYVLAHTARNRSLHTWLRFFQATFVARGARRAGIQHLHAHFADGTARIAMLASKLTGTPYSFTAHARDIFRAGINRALLREKIADAAFVVTVSEYNRRFLESHVGAGADKLRVVYNGVDLERFHPDPNVERQQDLVLAVGRLVPKKGFGDLIGACRLLREQGIQLRCRIIGEGLLRDDLEQQARDLGGAVGLIGPRSQEEVALEYRQAAVFVLPAVIPPDGNTDALPTVLIEALASGCPMISTRVAGIPEIVEHEEDGFLVEPGDPVALASAIERVLADPQLRARFSASARRKAESQFDARATAADLYRLFADADRVERTPAS
jgi:glycosyltransferase involved in cell wall biosynthesis